MQVTNEIRLETSRKLISKFYRMDEAKCIDSILKNINLPYETIAKIQSQARNLIVEIRKQQLTKGGIDTFLFEYGLSSDEGVSLMCLAEALLRIPDNKTVDLLIQDKISCKDWAQYQGKSKSKLVNATNLALQLTDAVLKPSDNSFNLSGLLKTVAQKTSSPLVRQSVMQAMKILGKQFVTGKEISEALTRSQKYQEQGYRYSYDMLGEAARTMKDADKYFASYKQAIIAIGQSANNLGPILGPGVSVKLSALHPRYEFKQHQRVMTEMLPKVLELVSLAIEYNIGFTIDAEEANRLEISLDIIQAIVETGMLKNYIGFGIAVQAYQKRALAVLDWLGELSELHQVKFMVRLVKGAYWDSEIKWTQEGGFNNFPVFTRKTATDVAYTACIAKLFAMSDRIYPQFATHNAYTLATVLELAEGRDFEFQCLHGMGDSLYSNIVGSDKLNLPCRIYAPVGIHADLLSYLVRRILENGANSSFVNRILDEQESVDDLISDPINKLHQIVHKPNPNILHPYELHNKQHDGIKRKNSKGIDSDDKQVILPLLQQIASYKNKIYTISNSKFRDHSKIFSPINHNQQIGNIQLINDDDITKIINNAIKAKNSWNATDVAYRAKLLEITAGFLEQNSAELLYLLINEAGKSIDDGIAEIREAVDFCYYYAQLAIQTFKIKQLPGPTGECNKLSMHGRGVFICISPWNFPLAIFLGQITAALVAGNTVIAKPASQTGLIANFAVNLLHKAGIPKDVLQFAPAPAQVIAKILSSNQIDGVMFTGSNDTATLINQSLATRDGAIIPFVAETGGQNAMIVDSSALPEQVVVDIMHSAFGSSGQRCSALRVLFIQEDIQDKMLEMLVGAMQELKIGDPMQLDTDIGPVIDQKALNNLNQHLDYLESACNNHQAQLIYQAPITDELLNQGYFFAPRLYKIDNLNILQREVFGPILHVVSYNANTLNKVIENINATGYGLTLGVHSRINSTVEYICNNVKVGNLYVNRNMIGAVVGVQPFGGEGLSGTGPKAGGPNYLARLAIERTLSVNTAASGGNASLMSMAES